MNDSNKILVVDDNDLLREVLVDLLSLYGLTVTSANSGRCAYNAIVADPSIKVVISDMRMPDGDGRDLMIALHALEREVKPGLILISGNSDEVSEDAMKQYQVRQILVKPIDKHLLLTTIAQCLDA